MPGFHEHVEGIEPTTVSEEINTEKDDKLDNTEQIEEPTAQATSSQSCPVCCRILDDMDNTAINSHLDFCLSKCAIKEATVEPPTPYHHKSPKPQKKPTKNESTSRKQGRIGRGRQTRLEL